MGRFFLSPKKVGRFLVFRAGTKKDTSWSVGQNKNQKLAHFLQNTKKQHTSYDKNYLGVGGTNVPQPVNEDNYNNAETNATKEIIAQGRYPVPEGDKYYNSKETYNIEIKKDEQDYFNHRQTHYDRSNSEYLAKNTNAHITAVTISTPGISYGK